LIVGAEKAGTTTLATMLAQHPEVFMCTQKKPGVFSVVITGINPDYAIASLLKMRGGRHADIPGYFK
jgi:hypothetical protein